MRPLPFQRRSRVSAAFVVVVAQLLFALGCAPTTIPLRTRAKYTEVTVKYSGIECSWQRHDRAAQKERADTMTIAPTKTGNVTVIILDSSLGDFEITRSTTQAIIKKWGGASARIGDATKAVYVSNAAFRFSDGVLIDVFVQGYYMDRNVLRISQNGKSVTWPCSREELANVLGEPLSTNEVVQEVGGP